MSRFVHQVELKLSAAETPGRLKRIEAWCTDWEIDFRVHETMSDNSVRVVFAEARFARAFHAHFGGVIVPTDELEIALAADASEGDLYDQLAGEYPD